MGPRRFYRIELAPLNQIKRGYHSRINNLFAEIYIPKNLLNTYRKMIRHYIYGYRILDNIFYTINKTFEIQFAQSFS